MTGDESAFDEIGVHGGPVLFEIGVLFVGVTGRHAPGPDQLAGEALPTLFKKAIETALPGALKPKRP